MVSSAKTCSFPLFVRKQKHKRLHKYGTDKIDTVERITDSLTESPWGETITWTNDMFPVSPSSLTYGEIRLALRYLRKCLRTERTV